MNSNTPTQLRQVQNHQFNRSGHSFSALSGLTSTIAFASQRAIPRYAASQRSCRSGLDSGVRIGRGCDEPDSSEICLFNYPDLAIPGFLLRMKLD